MKIILADVISVDGRTTKGTQPGQGWASADDQQHIHALIQNSRVIVMGSNTYREAKPHQNLSPKTLRIVMTHEPEVFKDDVVIGQREFTSEPPKELVSRLEKEGYKELLLVSGEKLSAVFLIENLVNELWVTIEPLLFGSGKGITTALSKIVNLELLSSEKLNQQGTLLLKYRVMSLD